MTQFSTSTVYSISCRLINGNSITVGPTSGNQYAGAGAGVGAGAGTRSPCSSLRVLGARTKVQDRTDASDHHDQRLAGTSAHASADGWPHGSDCFKEVIAQIARARHQPTANENAA